MLYKYSYIIKSLPKKGRRPFIASNVVQAREVD